MAATRYHWRRYSAVSALLLGLVCPPTLQSPVAKASPVARIALYPNGASLLRSSLTTQNRVPVNHSSGTLSSSGCCPVVSASARFIGDCVRESASSFAMRFSARGTVIPSRAAIAIDSHFILRLSNRSGGVWVRSLQTHNKWKVDRTRDWELGLYLCPWFLIQQIHQHFPSHLANLGPVTVRGVAAWQVEMRIGAPNSLNTSIFQVDYFLARGSLHWLRYSLVSRSGTRGANGYGGQMVSVNYYPGSSGTHIAAPGLGTSRP